MDDDFMAQVQQLRDAWSIATTTDVTVLDTKVKTEFEENVQALDHFVKTKCHSVSIPTLDTSIFDFWGYGHLAIAPGALKMCQQQYPWLDKEWLINVLLFRTKWLVVKLPLLQEANRVYKKGPRVCSVHELKSYLNSKNVDIENSYRKYEWEVLTDLFTGTVDLENQDIQDFRDGRLVMVSRGFCRVSTDYLASPLLPSDLHDRDLCQLYSFGAFPSGLFSQFVGQ